MSNSELANRETDKSVDAVLSDITPKYRQEDCRQLVQIMRASKSCEPKVWGERIIAFGKYTYTRKNGKAFEWFHVGFSANTSKLTIYLMFDLKQESNLLAKLGPHSTGKGCLYLKRLNDVDLNVLKILIDKSDRWER